MKNKIELSDLQSKIPKRPFLKPMELVRLGIASKTALGLWRKKGVGPKWIQTSDRAYIYLREDVINWLIECSKENT